MGRPGVTYDEVVAAIHHLNGAGKSPTVEQLRRHLNRGSHTTLVQHLKRWKAAQQTTSALSKEAVPPALLHTVQGLWEQMHALTQATLESHQQALETEKAQWQTQQAEQASAHQALQATLEETQATLKTTLAEQQRTAQALQAAQQQHHTLTERLARTTAQKEAYHADIQRLHHVIDTLQANLTHYQNALQEQQAERQLQYDTQHHQHAQAMAQCRHTVETLRTRNAQLETENTHWQRRCQQGEAHVALYHRLDTQYQRLLAVHSSLQQQYGQLEQQYHQQAQTVYALQARTTQQALVEADAHQRLTRLAHTHHRLEKRYQRLQRAHQQTRQENDR